MKPNRVIVGAFVTLIVVLVLTSDHFFSLGYLSAAFLAAISFIAAWELCVILESAGQATYPRLTAAASFTLTILPAVAFLGQWQTSPFAVQAGIILVTIMASFAVAMAKDDALAGSRAIASGAFTIIYVGLSLSFLVRLRFVPEVGEAFLFLVLASAKGGDMGAYFIGRRFGRHPLAPRTSPKKTIEGALGSVAAAVLLAAVIWYATGVDASIPLWIFLIWGAVINVAGQFGDLAESLLKRAADVKDSSIAFGKMGGILDVVDSLLLSAPVAYILALSAHFSTG